VPLLLLLLPVGSPAEAVSAALLLCGATAVGAPAGSYALLPAAAAVLQPPALGVVLLICLSR
jgi:hypothetical protein